MRLLFCLLLVAPFITTAQSNTDDVKQNPDYESVHQAVENYVNALYEAKPKLIAESIDSTLRKIGYYYSGKEKGYADNLPMTYTQLYNLAARWNSDGKSANADSPKEITIYDIQSKTASAKLVAEWGMDYFHLSKVNGQWKIVNVMWQSLPKL